MLPDALPYHLKVRDFFRRQTSTWEFFAAARTREEDSPYSEPILEKLNEEERLAFIAHEQARVHLFTLLEGDLEVADRIVTAIANHRDSETPYLETARLFKLYTELYCDRGAYTVLGDPAPVISMLLKLATGLSTVNGEGENLIRTRALRLWHEQGEDAAAAIRQMIEGVPDLDRLDLFAQQELSDLTRDFLQAYLQPDWFRTTVVMALEKQYFPDPAGRSGRKPEQLREAIAGLSPDIHRYFGYVLLDFTLADPALEDIPAGRAFEFAEEMQLTAIYDGICQKEWQLNDKKWQQHKQKVQKAYAELSKD